MDKEKLMPYLLLKLNELNNVYKDKHPERFETRKNHIKRMVEKGRLEGYISDKELIKLMEEGLLKSMGSSLDSFFENEIPDEGLTYLKTRNYAGVEVESYVIKPDNPLGPAAEEMSKSLYAYFLAKKNVKNKEDKDSDN